jgi:hypothetical protein
MSGFLSDYFHGLFSVFLSEQFAFAMRILYELFPFWGPPLLALGLFYVWVQYVRADFIAKQKYILLEVRLPRDVYKSPLAMELALSGFHVTAGESTWYDKYILGKVRAWFSFEIVSIEGNIHFFIWTREAYRNVVEAQLYGQYPDLEILEVKDYTDAIPYFDPEKVHMWAHEYGLSKADVYPIKTYVDFGLDKDPKEEFKVDPLTSVLEYMATLKKGEQMWMQIVVQAHKEKIYPVKDARGKVTGSKQGSIVKEAEDEVKRILASLKEEAPNVLRPEEEITFTRFPTRGEAEVIAAIQRHAGKLNFDCGIRLIYAAKPGGFNGARIAQSMAILKPFATLNMNSFAVNWAVGFNFPWQDFKNIRGNYRRREVLKAYRLRSWFHQPVKKDPFVLSSEELATVFHMPGGVLQVPSVERVMSKRAEAPTNLPQ